MPILHGGSSKFRQGVLQLMIHSVDPLHEEILQSQAKNAGSRPESSAEKSTALAAQHHTHPPGATECPLCADGLPTVNGDLVGDHDESNNNPAVEDEGNKGYRIQLAQVHVTWQTHREFCKAGSILVRVRLKKTSCFHIFFLFSFRSLTGLGRV